MEKKWQNQWKTLGVWDRIGYVRKGGDGTGLLIYYEPVGPESPQSCWSLGVLSHVDRKQNGHGKYSGNSQSSEDTSLKLIGSRMRILDFLSSQVFIIPPPPKYTGNGAWWSAPAVPALGGGVVLKQEDHERETNLEWRVRLEWVRRWKWEGSREGRKRWRQDEGRGSWEWL